MSKRPPLTERYSMNFFLISFETVFLLNKIMVDVCVEKWQDLKFWIELGDQCQLIQSSVIYNTVKKVSTSWS